MKDLNTNDRHNMAFLPVWLWEVITPIADKEDNLNFFQRTILELLKYNKRDRMQMSQWLNIDAELVDIIINELFNRGYVNSDKGIINLTPLGWQALDKTATPSYKTQLGYIIQDAIDGHLWPRVVAHKLNYLDVVKNDHSVTIKADRNTGQNIEPFIVNTSQKYRFTKPTKNEFRQALELYKRAVASGRLRNRSNDSKKTATSNINLGNFDIASKQPTPYFILTHLQHSIDTKHFSQLQDPLHITQSDDWIIHLHDSIAQGNKPFASKVKRFMGLDQSDKQSVEEFEAHLQEEMRFEILSSYPNVDEIDNLDMHLAKLLRRQKYLEEHNYSADIDDLLLQSQKSLEACFKHVLTTYPHQHYKILPYSSDKKFLLQALILRANNRALDESLEPFSTCNVRAVQSAIGFSTGKYPTIYSSLKPIITANILAIADYSNHPLLLTDDLDADLLFLSQICDYRNESSHDGPKTDITQSTALDLAKFTTQWVQNYLNQLTDKA